MIAAEVGPTKVASGFGLIDFVVAAGASFAVFARVVAHVAPVEPAGCLIYADAVGVAGTHRIDFRSSPGWIAIRAVFRKKIALGNFI